MKTKTSLRLPKSVGKIGVIGNRASYEKPKLMVPKNPDKEDFDTWKSRIIKEEDAKAEKLKKK